MFANRTLINVFIYCVSDAYQYSQKFLPLGEAIASRAVFVIVSGWTGSILKTVKQLISVE